MRQPLTVVLTRIFSRGFFKVHAGLLLFLFVTFVSYAFFINTLGDVPVDAFTYFQQLITITLVSSPFIMLLFFIVCLIYNIKSWQYVLLQLSADEQQFIYYSSNAIRPDKQLLSWFCVQLLINMPAFIYASFALCIGFIWHHYLLPLVIFVYLLLLTTAGAVIYLRRVNSFSDTPPSSWLLRITGGWKKPLYSLFIYHVLDQRKISYIITKALTALIMSTGLFQLLEDAGRDLRVAGVAVLFIVLAHSVLVYQEQQFEQNYLGFIRNFPYSRQRIYLYSVLTHIILLLPELSWMLTAFRFPNGIILVLTAIANIQLLRSLCYRYSSTMRAYLGTVFILFTILLWGYLYGGLLWLAPLSLAVSGWMFYKDYYRQA